MSPSDANTLSHEEKNPAASLCTLDLEPLRADGPDALIPDPAERILDVKVHRIDILWENALHELNTTIAVDVFHSVASVENDAAPIPPGAKLIHATFHFLFPDSPQPHAADISPPNTLRLQFSDD